MKLKKSKKQFYAQGVFTCERSSFAHNIHPIFFIILEMTDSYFFRVNFKSLHAWQIVMKHKTELVFNKITEKLCC